MIRFRCPKCDKRLGVDESQAGRIGVCPECKSQFRIPESQDDEIERPVQKASRPTRADDEPSSSVLQRRRIEDDEGLPSDYEDEETRPARKRKRKRRKTPGPSFDGFTIASIGLEVVVLIFLWMSLIWSTTSFLLMGLGFIMGIIGGLWFVVVVFQDSPVAGLLCLFVPFFNLYYLVTHFEEVKRPFFMQLLGVILFMVGVCAGALSA